MMSGKKNKKSKGTTLSLQEFNSRLEDKVPAAGQNVIYASKKKAQPMTSWADEVDDDDYFEKERIVLPSAPRAVRGPAYDDSEIPKEPPFSAHLGNLSYDIGDDDVYKFFRDLDVVELRLPRDGNSNRLRGFGHVEFGTRQDLVEALIKNEQMLKGRPVRISLGSNNTSRNDDRRGGDRDRGDRGYQHHDDTPDDWRSAMQAKSLDFDSQSAPPSSNFGRRDGPDRRDRNRDMDRGSRDMDRGSRDLDRRDMYSMPPQREFDREGGGRREYDREGGGGRRGDRDFDRGHRERSVEDEGPDDWRSSMRPREETPREFQRPPPREPRERDYPTPQPVFERRVSDEHRGPPPSEDTQKEEPRQRKKLIIAPRTIPVPPGESAPEAATASIFGGAKPVDTSVREREIEEKLAQASIKPKETTPSTTTTTDSPTALEDTPPPRERSERERGGPPSRDRGDRDHRSDRDHRGGAREQHRDIRGSDIRGPPPERESSREGHHHQQQHEREHEHDDREHENNRPQNGQENEDSWELVKKNNSRRIIKSEKN